MAEVACVGILVADVFANPIPRLPAEGELTTTSGFATSVGGCAANVAVALRILGRSVRIAGKVGTDMFGNFVIADLERHGIETRHVQRTPRHSTSGTVIFTVEGEDRRYLHCIGANADFTLADVDGSLLDGVRVLYVGGYLAMPGFTPAQLAELFQEARRRNITTVLDVVMPAGASFGLEHLAAALPYVDYFLPNQDEAARLTGCSDPRAQAERLSMLSPASTIVITCGPRGSLARRETRIVDTPAFPMTVIDESGAGDAFTAGLITGLLENWELDYTLSFAAAVGASCTRALGCSAGVFTFDEAVAYLHGKTAGVMGMER
ncbi:MAG TPA: carbohydrate kinase family protein [Bryobacteraceae bacterium]|nr:carbohydrate kinase family protein [Bryobacteraceae bacterium]